MFPHPRFPLPKFGDKYRSIPKSARIRIGAVAGVLAVAGLVTAVATTATPTASAAKNMSTASRALNPPAHHQAGRAAAKKAQASPSASHGQASHGQAAKSAPGKPAPAKGTSTQAPAPAKSAGHKPAPAHKAPAHKAPAHKAPAHKAPAHKSAGHKSAAAKAPAGKAPAHRAPAHGARAHKARARRPSRHDYRIYDSVTPSALPRHNEVAIYSNGSYAAPRSAVAGRPMLYIDTNGSNPKASVLDVEPGDATPYQAAVWARARLSANPHALARIYTMRSEWAATKAAVDRLPASMRSRVRWWIADPTGVPHIVPGSDATQWYWGSSYDISTATPKFG